MTNARPILISVLLLVLMTVAGCQQADVEQAAAVDETSSKEATVTAGSTADGSTSSEVGAEARAGNGKAVAKAGDGKARAGDAVAGEGKGRASGDGSFLGRAVLRIGGDLGAKFSGACAVDGVEKDISGRVPERIVYELDGRKLKCEVRKVESTAGALEISLNAGGLQQDTTVQSQGDEVSFALTKQGTSFSTFSSSGSGGSANQKSRIRSSSSSSVSSSSKR